MEFEKIEKFVQKEYGINLSAYKSKQLIRRIENFMQRAGAKNEIDFITKLSSDSNLSKKFLDHLTINVSEFFRNKELFLDLEQKIKYYLRPEKNSLKIWSAACSIGAEPYTLAIIMDRLTPNKKHTIIATDIDQTILEVAKQGVYNKNEIRNVDDNTLNKYFTKKDDKFYISEDIKKRVTFKKHDLILDKYESGFDLIVCRNVVIYFTQETKNKIYQNFYNSLKPGGLLFVGATESIYNYKEFGYEKASTFIYRKPGGN
ncbi:CheR family methyltransferase [Caloramator proteoclasticus]|uniref:protein-glutamate O-methyltransferase n=1 Tax=Caloramator proteoclasticus DSM 10124 TaxID=1121262 RepID=A0A1M4SWC7_9CLOT|nr:protein-glutamate O-methyltransferase CheR [Caloramator proteoclasticus]SHE36492.1 chemotaxis protein methyltransferase CheR [Caloramator proteoclasticus DSM 10124]